MAAASGVIGVDTRTQATIAGRSTCHVQICNVPDAVAHQTPSGAANAVRVSMEHAPWPDVEQVWAAWCGVTGGAAGDARRS